MTAIDYHKEENFDKNLRIKTSEYRLYGKLHKGFCSQGIDIGASTGLMYILSQSDSS